MGENVAITIVKLLHKTDNIITILAVTPTAFILCISSRATHTYSSASRIYLTILLGINFKHLLWLCLFLSPPQENRAGLLWRAQPGSALPPPCPPYHPCPVVQQQHLLQGQTWCTLATEEVICWFSPVEPSGHYRNYLSPLKSEQVPLSESLWFFSFFECWEVFEINAPVPKHVLKILAYYDAVNWMSVSVQPQSKRGSLNLDIFGGGAFGRSSGHEGWTLMSRTSASARRDTRREASLPTVSGHSKEGPSVNLEESFHQSLTALALWSWTSQLAELWEMNFCYLSHRSTGLCYSSYEWAKTLGF